MADTISFNNVTTAVPGTYSRVNAAALTQVGLTATGRVALIGTAVGGKPYTAITSPSDFVILTQPSQIQSTFKSGDLAEAANIAFDPSSDANIVGGASEVVAMKINPATQASATLSGAAGPVLTVTSQDYGAFTNHIGVQVSSGSQKGLMLNITSDSLTETQDNLGGDSAFSLTYNGGTHGYTAMQAGVTTAGNVYATGTLDLPSLEGDVQNQLSAPSPIGTSYSGDGNDAGLALTVYGLDAQGAAQVMQVPSLATAPDQTVIFSKVLGAALWAAPCDHDVSVIDGNGNAIVTIKAGQQYAGIQPLSYAYVAQTTVSVQGSGAAAVPVMLIPAGNQTQAELLTLSDNQAVTSTGTYTQLGGIVTGGLGAQTATLTAKAVETDVSQQATVGAIISYFDSRSASVSGTLYGFDAEVGTASTSAPAAQLDAQNPVDCKAPATASFGDTLYSLVNWLNGNSRLVSATVATGAQGAPNTTATPVFLSGGSEGIATFQDYQNALNLLQLIGVDTIVPLSCDPDMAAALDAHCAYMNSPKGANERCGIVGVMNAAGTGLASKQEALSQAQALNTRNLSVVPMGVVRYNLAGNLQQFSPAFTAALAAGMVAGAPVGRALTNKYLKAVSMVNHPSWSPGLDADTMLQGGLLFTRLREGQGYYWVRDITCYLQSTNLAYQERGVNYACNYAVRDLRTAANQVIGLPAFANTASALQSVLKGRLDTLVGAGVLTSYQSPVVRQDNDTFYVEVSVAPTLPVNFVLLTLGVSATASATTAQAA